MLLSKITELGAISTRSVIISVFQINTRSINIFPTPVSLSLSRYNIYVDVNK